MNIYITCADCFIDNAVEGIGPLVENPNFNPTDSQVVQEPPLIQASVVKDGPTFQDQSLFGVAFVNKVSGTVTQAEYNAFAAKAAAAGFTEFQDSDPNEY
jgi:hypothetical protein